MENIKEFPCGILDPVISWRTRDGGVQRALDPGPKPQAPSVKLQAQQASSNKLQALKRKP